MGIFRTVASAGHTAERMGRGIYNTVKKAKDPVAKEKTTPKTQRQQQKIKNTAKTPKPVAAQKTKAVQPKGPKAPAKKVQPSKPKQMKVK